MVPTSSKPPSGRGFQGLGTFVCKPQLKSSLGLEHTRHRSPINALVHILSCLAAYTLAQPKVKMGKVHIPDPMPSILSIS